MIRIDLKRVRHTLLKLGHTERQIILRDCESGGHGVLEGLQTSESKKAER